MTAKTFVQEAAVDRLAALGLSVEIVERVVRRADAEASMCTPLDPPILEGMTRWGRTTRFLREELVPPGWQFDNPRNLARTIHPSREWAIVATSGDELTGLVDLVPATKYPKGGVTVRAVEVNEQLTLDLGDLGVLAADESRPLLTWFLLTYVDPKGLQVEISLPDAIEDGRITSWAERVILPFFPREDLDQLVEQDTPDEDDHDGSIHVEVNRR